MKASIAVGSAASAYGELSPALPQASQALPVKQPELNLHPRGKLLLDFGWRFRLGDADDEAKDLNFGARQTFAKAGRVVSAARVHYDDSSWRQVDLPHDWAVELPFVDDPQLESHGYHPLSRKHPATSIGWYRRVFEIPAADRGKRLAVEFDGVFRNAMVLLNGNYLGTNFSGYAPCHFDITDFVKYGKPNALVLRVDATLEEGWFYEGAGIYRHVWLTKTNPVHVAHWGTFVRSGPDSSPGALVIETELENEQSKAAGCRIQSTILDAQGNRIANASSDPAQLKPWSNRKFVQQLTVDSPNLWSPDSPHLYRLLTEMESGGAVQDRYVTSFGIRTTKFDPDHGFFLNGKPLKIKGTCNHQDHAGLGSALPDRVQYYRIQRLKEMGSNAYRTSHNAPTPELLEACDRLGMLVMDETRMMESSPEGLSQLSRLVRRDRNHPSVFIWSLANEEPEQGSERGARIVTSMKRLARRLDPSRPVTAAMNNDWGMGISGVVDVQGFNYNLGKIDAFHKKFPHQPTVGTETASTVCTRGIYKNDKEKGYVSAYDKNYPPWASTAEQWWNVYAVRAFLSGGFAWTGFDYRGEPTPYSWPCINSHFGIMDTCGFAKDNFYYYKAWWGAGPVLHLFPHWNWTGKEGQGIEVWCHTNLQRVELFLNGKSLGFRDVKPRSHVQWTVPYTPGKLEAKGYRDGKLVLTAVRETTGAPAKIVLHHDRKAAQMAADGEDAMRIAVEVQDAQGRIMPTAGNEISFDVSGSGKLIGVGNGDPSCHESDKGSKRSAFNGLCMAIVQASKQPGALRLTASADRLASASLTIDCVKTAPRPSVAIWTPPPVKTGPGIIGRWVGSTKYGQVECVFDQNNGNLTGSLTSGFGEEQIRNGHIDGNDLSFRAGNLTYHGTMNGPELRLNTTFGHGGRATKISILLKKAAR
ncbi:MAG: beta-galactosidase GalA [Bryobacteraceae bacterium]